MEKKRTEVETKNVSFFKFDEHEGTEFKVSGLEPYEFTGKDQETVNTYKGVIDGEEYLMPTHSQLIGKIKAFLELEKEYCFITFKGKAIHPKDKKKTVANYSLQIED